MCQQLLCWGGYCVCCVGRDFLQALFDSILGTNMPGTTRYELDTPGIILRNKFERDLDHQIVYNVYIL